MENKNGSILDVLKTKIATSYKFVGKLYQCTKKNGYQLPYLSNYKSENSFFHHFYANYCFIIPRMFEVAHLYQNKSHRDLDSVKPFTLNYPLRRLQASNVEIARVKFHLGNCAVKFSRHFQPLIWFVEF